MAVVASARQGRVHDRLQVRLRDPTHTCPEDLLAFDEHVIVHPGLTDWIPYYVVRAPHLERYADGSGTSLDSETEEFSDRPESGFRVYVVGAGVIKMDDFAIIQPVDGN